MGGLSIWHWLIVGAVLLLVFGGKGKISDIMGDVAKGIKSFKKGLAEEEQKPEVERPGDPPMRTIDHQTAANSAKNSRHPQARLIALEVAGLRSGERGARAAVRSALKTCSRSSQVNFE